jgi:hypothetical protein
MKDKHIPDKVIRIAGSISLLALPLLLATAFALHYTRLSEFLAFSFSKPAYSPAHLLNTLSSADGGFRLYTLPHMVGYLSLPLFISMALIIAVVTFRKTPWHALLGAALTGIGVVFLGGVFGAWLSFAAVGNISGETAPNLVAVLKALTNMQGPLMISSVLSAFAFLGLIVLGFGLYQSRTVPRWSAVLFILGNAMILAFMDMDNWMFIGAVLMLLGMLPLAARLYHAESQDWFPAAKPA